MRLNGLLGKKWLIPLLVILIIALAIETALLVVIVIQSFGGRQALPGISAFRLVTPGCQTPVPTVESTTSNNRTVFYTCPIIYGSQRAALLITGGSPLDCFKCQGSPVVVAVPTFSLPPGYLALSLSSSACSTSGVQHIPLTSGKEIGLGGESSSYNYCTVISNSASKVDSFTIDWSNGTPPISRPTPFTLSVSPLTQTVPTGGTVNLTITLASLNGWTGNVTVSLAGGYPLRYTLNPPISVLRAGGSSVTTLREPTCNADRTYCARPGSNVLIVDAYTSCLVPVPGAGCADGYMSAEVSVNVNVV